MPEVPRLTRALRAFTHLGRTKEESEAYISDLTNKRLERAVQRTRELSWKEFCTNLPKTTGPILAQIRNAAAKFCEGELPSVVDHIAISVLQMLIREKYVNAKLTNRLETTMVGVTPDTIRELMQVVSHLRNQLTEENIEFIVKFDGDSSEADTAKSNRFGESIVYNPAIVAWPDTGLLHDMCPLKVSRPADDFTMSYDKLPVSSNKSAFDKNDFVKGLKQCYATVKNSTDMTHDQFVSAIEDKLKNSAGNLENELFDLMGYENIQFIEYLIEHRHSLASLLSSQKTRRTMPARLPEQPGYSYQVTVQSAKEKQLMKQYRKEEKKMIKASSKHEANGNESDDEIDPIALRLKRQEVLMAQKAPILTPMRRVVGTDAREHYPFVFDSKLTTKITAGVVSGKNIMLPEDVTRKDSQLCEEVHIPIPPEKPLEVGNEPVLISTLDEIGQMAFSGVKSLNRIQSIVFDAAYHSNENLLICAPTGAGKTNVAMLTVIHQLKLHMENGVLKKNEFKIIYIAPMKALAAEMTANFNKKLGCLGVSVRELTGDMQLTKTEIQQTQMIVTTPEKWDVVTRKGSGDIALTSIVKLLIIDEVHLLHGDRGPVVEALVARTLRQVESSQSMIRIVGLSATLPNYVDVARFLRVNPYKGLFYFDHRFRPVPLSQTFIGVKSIKPSQQIRDMDLVCYNQVVDMVRKGHQVMVFVHARNATIRTANALKDIAGQNDTLKLFKTEGSTKALAQKCLGNSRNKYLGQLFQYGFSVHHAGMLRSDRNMVEKYFSQGLIKVLVCTSTLAWGVNLPAHAVVIRGTEIYDSKHGTFIDLGILDVLQIFGRAGRPQYDTTGHAVIITSHAKLSHYLSLLTNQFPIESSFVTYLADNLNAEIALGTISNVEEAVEWLSYTYLFVRMKLNNLAYGIQHQTIVYDPNLDGKRRELIDTAAKALDKARMIRYHPRTGDLSSTDLGRTASHYYLKYDTVEIFNDLTKPIMTEADILGMISRSQEFEQLKVRDDEMTELDDLSADYCEVIPQGGTENIHGKVNILMQTYLSQGRVNSFSLQSDQAYITQNAMRICRAIFEVMLRKNNAIMAGRLLSMAKMLESQQWDHMSAMRQFRCLGQDIIDKIEERNLTVDRLREMDVREIGLILRNQKSAALIKKCCDEFPGLEMESSLQPITRTVLRIRLKVYPNFTWNDRIHGKSSEAFWIWIEDPDNNFIYHHEYFVLTRKMVLSNSEQELVMTIPLTEPLPAQYYVKATSDRWLGCETTLPLTFHNLILPEVHPPHTDLLELQPLPVTALKDSSFEALYRFTHFNPIQTQIFHCLYHTDANVLLGAPTGSGKTIAAEMAMFRVFKQYPDQKVVYIAPLKALVRERMIDWKVRIEEKLGKTVVELTGDVTPDMRAVERSSVIVTTPEKWDGISRSWQTRNYVKKVALIIIDEIHLLGEDRGPVLEVIVSRTNFIASHTKKTLRIVGLSTALANANDLADWLGIKKMGLYNFRPSVRPVPLEVHTSGFPGKHYCPRMATMNRPTFQAIRQHAPDSPSLVFVSSRRQTRLTALDLIAYLAAENQPKQWLHMPEEEMNDVVENIKDTNLKLTLAFGIGIHHAGLQERDRRTVEELFVNNKIQKSAAEAHRLLVEAYGEAALSERSCREWFKKFKNGEFDVEDKVRSGRPKRRRGIGSIIGGRFVRNARVPANDAYSAQNSTFSDEKNYVMLVLIATSTLAWGVNFPAHLVVIKGTEYYDGKTKRYVDMPITDVLQMMGRAGRPQFDNSGVAVVLVHDIKKNFYKKFLYDPFPVESSLLQVLPDHVNAEIVAGTIKTKQEFLDYLTWTYFFRRLMKNPRYYDLEVLEPEFINQYLSELVERTLKVLMDSHCLELDQEEQTIFPLSMGRIASYYYLSHITIAKFDAALQDNLTIEQCLKIMCDAHEYDEIPVRHNEDILNEELAKRCRYQVDRLSYDSPNTKAFLLLQAHFSRLVLPCADYVTDLKSVLDQSIRILQSMIDIVAERGWLATTLRIMQLLQMIIQARWIDESAIITLPYIKKEHLHLFASLPKCLPALCASTSSSMKNLSAALSEELTTSEVHEIHQVMKSMPILCVELSLLDTSDVANEKTDIDVTTQRCIDVNANQNYTLAIRLRRKNRSSNLRAHCPMFQRGKDEGWFLILGDVTQRELWALKRTSGINNQTKTNQLEFTAPSYPGQTKVTLYVMSDCYIGFDQQYNIYLNVIA